MGGASKVCWRVGCWLVNSRKASSTHNTNNTRRVIENTKKQLRQNEAFCDSGTLHAQPGRGNFQFYNFLLSAHAVGNVSHFLTSRRFRVAFVFAGRFVWCVVDKSKKRVLEGNNSSSIICCSTFFVYFLTMASTAGREIMNSEVAGSILTVFPTGKEKKGILSRSRTCTSKTQPLKNNDESNV